MEQFTASEVRELAKHMESVGWRPDSKGDPECYDEGAARSAEILFAFADLLEAREKAVPVAWMHPDLHDGHPYPEECLNQEKIEGWLPLYAHSAKAQPPAASVTDAMVNRLTCWMIAQFGECRAPTNHKARIEWWCNQARSALHAALAAQENPNG